MKFTSIQENLNFGLQTTGHLVNKNVNLPILNNVLLEAKNGTLKLASTNLEIGICCTVRCKIEQEGSFTVDAKLLADYISLLPNDQVEVNLLADDFLSVRCVNSATKIKGLVSDDFPVIPEIEKKNPIKVKIADFKKAVSQVIFAVANSEIRPEIGGVLFNFNKFTKGKLTLVGTDSYRLAEKIIDIEDQGEEKEVIVPLKTLQELVRILGNIKDSTIEDLQIYLAENQILFVCEGMELISRLIEGQYPDYKQIIPEKTKTKINVSTAELVKAIKKVSLFAKAGIFDVNLVFEAQKGLTVQSINSQLGESKSDLDVDFSGETNETTLNYRYLLDGLNNLDSSEVEISLVDNNLPGLFKPKGKEDQLYLIMPIKQ
ncbi:MAG: DNA polymerase III subunit beta [Patescibacteria group bacterium]